jgi:site-specific recombinase XerD
MNIDQLLFSEPNVVYGNKPVVRVTMEIHKGAKQLFLRFNYLREINEICKSIGATWSSSKTGWYIASSKENFSLIFDRMKGKVWLDIEELKKERAQSLINRLDRLEEVRMIKLRISPEQQLQVDEFYKMLKIRNYSDQTSITYIHLISLLLGYSGRMAEELSQEDIRNFQYEFWKNNNYSISTQRQFVGALRKFLDLYNTNIDIEAIPLPKREKHLPQVLSQEEVLELIRVTDNLKHKAMLSLLYDAGLRISELINLELDDIDFDSKRIHIRNAKGKKDRYVSLSRVLGMILLNYIAEYKPNQYVINGQDSLQYSETSIRQVLRHNASKAGIRKRVYPHILRHSYATHLIENGVNIRYIQELLGHSHIHTTEIYTHVAMRHTLGVKSPLDGMADKLVDNRTGSSSINLRISQQKGSNMDKLTGG